jgi:hypothetical protein
LAILGVLGSREVDIDRNWDMSVHLHRCHIFV